MIGKGMVYKDGRPGQLLLNLQSFSLDFPMISSL